VVTLLELLTDEVNNSDVYAVASRVHTDRMRGKMYVPWITIVDIST
jgi:hypothetical protein